MENKRVAIWGAGKIGRGFVGDLFNEAGYDIDFIDANADFVRKLNDRGYYTVYNLRSSSNKEKHIIRDFNAYDIEDRSRLNEVLSSVNLMAIAVFPDAFDLTAELIAYHIEQRLNQSGNSPLDILICANMHNPGAVLLKYLKPHLSALTAFVRRQ